MHVIDAQSPARLEPMAEQDHSLWGGAMRPQDTLTVHVAAAMVDAMSAARFSPLTGAPMSAAVVTGDSADMHSELELAWYIDALDGGEILANSGPPGLYEGVQAWSEATYAWHPDDPTLDQFGAYGFPAVPGLLISRGEQSDCVRGPARAVVHGLRQPRHHLHGDDRHRCAPSRARARRSQGGRVGGPRRPTTSAAWHPIPAWSSASRMRSRRTSGGSPTCAP